MHDATAANAVKMEIIKKNTSFLVGLYHQVENRTRAHEKSPGGEPGENGEIMKYEEIVADINGPWSNAACMGYCLIAMRRAGLRPTVQHRVLRVLEGVFDDVSVEKAEKTGYANKEE